MSADDLGESDPDVRAAFWLGWVAGFGSALMFAGAWAWLA